MTKWQAEQQAERQLAAERLRQIRAGRAFSYGDAEIAIDCAILSHPKLQLVRRASAVNRLRTVLAGMKAA
jgi:hypothetical protein